MTETERHIMSSPLTGKNVEYARRILGRRYFDLLLRFFFEVDCKIAQMSGEFDEKSGGIVLTVYFTRRCQVLMQVFQDFILYFKREPAARDGKYEWLCRLTEKQILSVSKKSFVTDMNLKMNITKLREMYKASGIMPRIVIVDELFVFGRTLSRLLLDIERYFKDDEETFKKFRDSLFLYVYAQSDDIKLLPGRYRSRILSNMTLKLSAAEIRNLSMRLSQLVSISGVNNVGYSWSLRVPAEHDRWLSSNGAYSSERWRWVRSNIYNIRQDTFIWLYPDPKHIKAICTVRCKTSSFAVNGSKRQMYVPFVMFDKLPRENVEKLRDRFLNDMKALGRDRIVSMIENSVPDPADGNEDKFYCRACEQDEMILGYLAMRSFMGSVLGYESEDIKSCVERGDVDLDQLARNYSWVGADAAGLVSARDALSDIWDWEPAEGLLEEYLDILLENVPPFWSAEHLDADEFVNGTECNDSVMYRVQDAIAESGYDAESGIRDRLRSGIIYSDEELAGMGLHPSLVRLLEASVKKINEQLKIIPKNLRYRADVYQIISAVVQCMDLGLLGMNIWSAGCDLANHDWEPEPQSHYAADELYIFPKAGEFSQFIMPLRYYEQARPLMYLMDLYEGNVKADDMYFRRYTEAIEERFGGDSPEYNAKWLQKSLSSFLNNLKRCGQNLKEWLFITDLSAESVSPCWYEDSEQADRARRESREKAAGYFNLLKSVL